MPLAANLQSHEYSFTLQVAQGVWRWTTRMDISGASPSFVILNIVSPFGILRDTVPILGEVITAMADSISELAAQFRPVILVGPPASLTFDVDTGRGFSEQQDALVTNSGVYGSLLDATLTPSASYVAVAPSTVGNLGFQESGTFQVSVDSTSLLPGIYNATILIQDDTATNTPQSLPITINVRPKAIIDVTPLVLTFNVVKPLSGAFPLIPNQVFTIENIGPLGSVLEFLVQRLTCLSDNWLVAFTPTSGTLLSGETQDVTVQIVPADTMATGTYQETLRVSGYSDNSYVDILVQLNIT